VAKNIQEDRINKIQLNKLLKKRILVIDGATGTALEDLNPTADDFGGEKYFGYNETLNEYAPQMVEAVHKKYLDAGVDFIETNSFNGTPVVMAEYDLVDRCYELVKKSAEHANSAIKKYVKDRKVYVIGSMGPGTKAISVTGGITFDEIFEAYKLYASALLDGGVDLLLLETTIDSLNLKASYQGIVAAQKELNRDVPVSISVTIEANGTMLAGQTIEALYHTLSGFDLFSIGLNCATGPEQMSDSIRTLSELSRFPVTVWPNAGLPNEHGLYEQSPDDFKRILGRYAKEGFLNIIGGCCGTTDEHIRALIEVTKGVQPRQVKEHGHYPVLTGNETTIIDNDTRPVFVGERSNCIGSRKFKRLVATEVWDEAAEIGRGQAKKGAMVIDLCTANPDRDEKDDFIGVLKPLLRRVRVPIMIDTTDTAVVEAALKTIGGKPAINSVNLEDGGERLREVALLAKQYGASLVCGLIDDDPESGMAVTVARKVEIAEKIHTILKDEFEIPDEDIIFDPLVFPCGTGDQNYLGSARETVEGVRKIKELYPNCLTVLGISNVSFGLPPVGREVINSVFMYECTVAGLDMAIVNTEKLKRYPSISEDDKKLAEAVLFESSNELITTFANRFRDAKPEKDEDSWAALTPDERVSLAVVEARKTGLIDNLNLLLKVNTPLEIINGPLMAGMSEVGIQFRDNRLIVAEVLESAEVMKAAVDYLKGFFTESSETSQKGKFLIATVKGDVHDIGKNLVDIILSNNNFEVFDLGIKVPPEIIIEAVKKHQPDMIGLSGLLVRSAQMMVHTAKDLTAAGIDIPLIVGGAALTKKFTLTQIAPAYNGPVFYAKDAMNGLELVNGLVDESCDELIEEWRQMQVAMIDKSAKEKASKKEKIEKRPTQWIETDVPEPPDYEEHIINFIDPDELLELINPTMLYGKHLGLKQVGKRITDGNDEQLIKLQGQVSSVLKEAVKLGVIAPKGIYQWFKATPTEDSIKTVKGDLTENLIFARQSKGRQTSALDWIRPEDRGGDSINLFVTTAGQGIADLSKKWKDEGRLLDSHILQALALEIAEASAEWVHVKIRKEWGFPDPDDFDTRDLFNTKYHGIRLSFGYPACPIIEEQEKLFKLLAADKIGVKLTEGFMMSPESSVSAIVFHHPEGRYYTE
jgi:5-methyltetrahydrofolate--homocysteine methyltransferase